jgi:hypothetical protein
MKMQARLLLIATVLALALGWAGLMSENARLEERIEAAR